MFGNYFDNAGIVRTVKTYEGKELSAKSPKSLLRYLKNRYDLNPEYREQQKEKARIQYLKKKALKASQEKEQS
jgi:hypothetical protein